MSYYTPPAENRQGESSRPSLHDTPLFISRIISKQDAKRLTHRDPKWSDFREWFGRPAVRQEKDGPAWIPAWFGDRTNEKGNLRYDGNVKSVSAVVLDLDGKGGHYAADDLRRHLDGLEYLAHTTFSSTKDYPRWRVVLPLRSPITPKQLPAALAYVESRTGLSARDTGCDNPSRLHYFPSCPPERRGDYQSLHEEGEWLDPACFPPSSTVGSRQKGNSGSAKKTPPPPGELSSTATTVLLNSGNPAPAPPPGTGKLLTLDDVVGLYREREVCLAVARHLQLGVEELVDGKSKTSDFSSPLPWRKDDHPSCALLMKEGEEIVLTDRGDPHGENYSLAQLALALASGKPLTREEGPILLVWRVRLLMEAGVIKPAPVPGLPPCPEDVPEEVRKVYEGFKLLLACKWRIKDWAGEKTVFTQGFAGPWCGIPPTTAWRATQELYGRGLLHICGKHKRASLFLPGPHFKHPAYNGRKLTEEERRGRKVVESWVRRIARKLKVKGDPTSFSLREVDELRMLVRSAPQLESSDRYLFSVWARPKLRKLPPIID